MTATPHFLARLWRHRTAPVHVLRRQLGPAARRIIEERIHASECGHSGEIRVCVESALPARALWRGQSARARALALFGELGIWNTSRRNGVLVYLLLAERSIEIVADRGLDACVPPATWSAIVERLAVSLRAGDFQAGLLEALDAIDSQLRAHFPLGPGQDRRNELPDTVVLR